METKITPLEFLQAVNVNDDLPLQARLKAAIEAAQYVHPRLIATAHLDGRDFGALLDTRLHKLAEAKPLAIEAKRAPSPSTPSNGPVPDRRFRR